MKIINNKLFKYLFCGGISALVELITFMGVYQWTPVYLASVLSFLVGLVSSYFLNKYIVFNKKEKSLTEATKFVALGLANSQLSAIITVGLSTIVPSAIAKGITIVFIAIWNFIIMNILIFKKEK